MPQEDRQKDADPDKVTEASKESFPASDAPASNAGSAGASSPRLDTIVAKGLLVTVEAKENVAALELPSKLPVGAGEPRDDANPPDPKDATGAGEPKKDEKKD